MSDMSEDPHAPPSSGAPDDGQVLVADPRSMSTADLIKRAEALVAESCALTEHIALFTNTQTRKSSCL